MDTADRDRYIVGAFVQACQVMQAFRKPGELLRLRDVVARTGLPKANVFRLLYTLHSTGFVEKSAGNQYRLRVALPTRPGCRIGYAVNGDGAFARLVTEGFVQAAESRGMEVIVLDNRGGEFSLRNADVLVREKVKVAIEFQEDESMAEALSAKFAAAGIPMIAIDVPHPGAVYFGANNYQAGAIAGREMTRWAKIHWQRLPLNIALIGYARAGSIVQSRMKGTHAALKEIRGSGDCRVFHLDSAGDFPSGYESVRKYLPAASARKTLVGAVNDAVALGALRCFEEAGLRDSCAVIGHNADPEARAELRRPGTRLIGSVARFPETYGEALVGLAKKLVSGPPPPPATFTRHALVTPRNVDRFYPNDALLDAIQAGVTAKPGHRPLSREAPA